MELSSQDRRWWLAVVAFGLVLKVALLLANAFPFHSDEAIVGLMARHILRGEWPAFFYGQAYMGSLDAALVAGSFALLGEAVSSIRVVQLLLYAATIGTTMLLAREITSERRTAIIAGALMALPTVNVTLYTTVSLGGYGEALLIGNLMLISALKFHRAPTRHWLAIVWGALAGLGLWVFGMTLVYSIPSGVLVVRTMIKNRSGLPTLAGSLLAAMIGAAPWLLNAIDQGPAAFVGELLGSAIAGASPAGLLSSALSHLANLLLFGPTVIFGLRPPWEIRWLAWPLLPLAAAFWIGALAYGLRRLRTRAAGRSLPFGMVLTLLFGFLITPFGADPSGRYFVPLTVPLVLMAGEFSVWLMDRRSRLLGYGAVAGILIFNLWGTLESAIRNPPGITTQFNPETRIPADQIPALAQLLESEGERRGYSNYWVAYPLAFHSDEELIFVPRLPYHRDFRYTPRDNRYPPYKGMVETSGRVAYITTQQPELDERIREGLSDAGVNWNELDLGDFHVFYSLGAPVRPEQIDLSPAPG